MIKPIKDCMHPNQKHKKGSLDCQGYLLLGHLLSGSILNHLMHSKDAECILMFLSAMPRGVSVAHIYVLKLPLHHLQMVGNFT